MTIFMIIYLNKYLITNNVLGTVLDPGLCSHRAFILCEEYVLDKEENIMPSFAPSLLVSVPCIFSIKKSPFCPTLSNTAVDI